MAGDVMITTVNGNFMKHVLLICWPQHVFCQWMKNDLKDQIASESPAE